VTVFLTTHYIEEAEFLSDRVAFVNSGSIVGTGEPGEVRDRLGRWAVDTFEGGAMETRFFKDRKEASAHIRDLPEGGTLRRVNLEDAFISLTGRRVS
jgi:ABC-2 type transport system ATP-binding protein